MVGVEWGGPMLRQGEWKAGRWNGSDVWDRYRGQFSLDLFLHGEEVLPALLWLEA